MCIGSIPSDLKSSNKSLYSFPHENDNYIYFDLEFTCNNVCIVRVKNGIYIILNKILGQHWHIFLRSINWGVHCDHRSEHRGRNYYNKFLRWVGQHGKRGLLLSFYQGDFDQIDRGISERVWGLQYQPLPSYRQESITLISEINSQVGIIPKLIYRISVIYFSKEISLLRNISILILTKLWKELKYLARQK